MDRKQGIQNNGLMHPETDGWGELHDLWAIEECAWMFHYSICEVEVCLLCKALETHKKNNTLYGQWLLVSRFIARTFGKVNPAVACLLRDEQPLCVAEIPDTISKVFHLDLGQQADLYDCSLSELEAIAGKTAIRDDNFWFRVALKLSDYVKERFDIGVD